VTLVYHYDVGVDMEQISFKTADGEEFVIGGLSMVRRGNEVTIMMITGLICDLDNISINLHDDYIPTPGKEKLKFDLKKGFAPVRLNKNPKYWKTLAACRFDLESNTIDARYIAKEFENSFSISPMRGIRPKAILCLSDTSDIAQEIETYKDKKKSPSSSLKGG